MTSKQEHDSTRSVVSSDTEPHNLKTVWEELALTAKGQLNALRH